MGNENIIMVSILCVLALCVWSLASTSIWLIFKLSEIRMKKEEMIMDVYEIHRKHINNKDQTVSLICKDLLKVLAHQHDLDKK